MVIQRTALLLVLMSIFGCGGGGGDSEYNSSTSYNFYKAYVTYLQNNISRSYTVSGKEGTIQV